MNADNWACPHGKFQFIWCLSQQKWIAWKTDESPLNGVLSEEVVSIFSQPGMCEVFIDMFLNKHQNRTCLISFLILFISPKWNCLTVSDLTYQSLSPNWSFSFSKMSLELEPCSLLHYLPLKSVLHSATNSTCIFFTFQEMYSFVGRLKDLHLYC